MLKALLKTIDFLKDLRHRRLFRKISVATLISICVAYLAVWVVFLVPHMMVAAQAWQYLMVDYVNISEVDPNLLFTRALQGLRSSIINRDVSISEGIIESMLELIDDPYTKYLTPEQYDAAMETISGEYVGIGIVMTVNGEGELEILAVMPGLPADSAGVETGDIIISIDGQSADGQDTSWAAELLRGNADTNVTMTIQRDGTTEPIQIPITRQVIELPSVVAEEIEENIVYIKLASFSENSGDEFIEKLGEHLDDDTIGIIVDVRDNPGGIVTDAVEITSQFLSAGVTVLHQVDSSFDTEYTYYATAKSLTKLESDIRVAILQNNDSASASEIFAGALQDARSDDTTAIIGTSSYGKGSVNHIIELVDGSAMVITSSYWTTPDDRYIGSTGIEPDILIEDENAQLDAAIIYVKNS